MSPGRILSMGKSRTTGCTSAEYDRPVSLRSLRSWIPARKSSWSRIIGDRAVRPIASSTSASIEARVPCTISTSTGSGLTAHHHVAELVHPGREARMDRERGAELLDHRRACDLAAQTLAPVDRRVMPAVAEEHRPPPVERVAARAHGPELGPRHRADSGHAQIDPLDGLPEVVAVAVAVQALVGVVEAGLDGVDERGVDRAVRRVDVDLERLAEVPEVGRPDDPALVALAHEVLEGLRLEPAELARERPEVELVVPADERLHVVGAQVGGEQPEGAEVARVAGDEDRPQAEDVDQPARRQRAGPAEGAEIEVAHVEPALDRDLADC